MEWLINLAFLVPWLSIFALWWLFLFGRVGVAQTIGGTILFFAATLFSVVTVVTYLKRLNDSDK